MKLIKFVLTASVFFAVKSVGAQGLPTESFESYANQAALDAVWVDDTNPGVILKTDGGRTGAKYVTTSGASPTAIQNGRKSVAINVTPTTATPVIVEFGIRPQTTSTLGRSYVEIRDSAAGNIVDFGTNNNVATPGWHARVVGGTPSTGANVFVAQGGTRVANVWKTLKFVIQAHDVRFYEDNVQIGAPITRVTAFPALTKIMVGSNLTSAVAVDYDDISVTVSAGVTDWSVY